MLLGENRTNRTHYFNEACDSLTIILELGRAFMFLHQVTWWFMVTLYNKVKSVNVGYCIN